MELERLGTGYLGRNLSFDFLIIQKLRMLRENCLFRFLFVNDPGLVTIVLTLIKQEIATPETTASQAKHLGLVVIGVNFCPVLFTLTLKVVK